jgi:hypothetical protein
MVWVSSQTRLAYGQEATFGTAATTDRFLGITNANADLPDKAVDVKEYNSFGAGRRRYKSKEGREEYGPATLDILPTTGEFFWYVFGTETFESSNNTPSGVENAHTLMPDDKGPTPPGTTTSQATKLPSFTLKAPLEGNPDFLRTFTGCTVEEATVSISEGGELQVSTSFRAKEVQDHDDANPTLPSQPEPGDAANPNDPGNPYMFYDRAANIQMMGSFDYSSPSYDQDDLGINLGSDGRTIAHVNSFNWSIRNGLKPQFFTHSGDAQKVKFFTTSQPEYSLSMDVVPAAHLASEDSNATYDLLEDGVQGDILIPFQRADGSDELHFVFQDCHIQASPHPWNETGDEVVTSVDVVPHEIRVISLDTQSAYNSL